jgi:hypothetical protein
MIGHSQDGGQKDFGMVRKKPASAGFLLCAKRACAQRHDWRQSAIGGDHANRGGRLLSRTAWSYMPLPTR